MKLVPDPGPFHLSTGRRGEMAGWHFLAGRGFRILEKNYRCPIGEIDVIAEKDRRLVFVEIKTRRSTRFGFPEESVTRAKQQKLAKLAAWYLKSKRHAGTSCSFAVLAILIKDGGESEMRLIEDAF